MIGDAFRWDSGNAMDSRGDRASLSLVVFPLNRDRASNDLIEVKSQVRTQRKSGKAGFRRPVVGGFGTGHAAAV
jgi:hypothetical protein